MVYEKLVSHKLSSYCEKHVFLAAAQFAYRKGLCCTDALLTICHHLQKSLDIVIETYIVQIDFSAAFDRVSNSGLLFKLKSIALGGCMCAVHLIVGRYSPTAGRESWLMVLLVSRSLSLG